MTSFDGIAFQAIDTVLIGLLPFRQKIYQIQVTYIQPVESLMLCQQSGSCMRSRFWSAIIAVICFNKWVMVSMPFRFISKSK